MKKLFFILSISMIMASCAVTHVEDDRVAYREYSVRNTEPTQSPIVVAPLLAELEILTEQSISQTVVYEDFTVRSSNIKEIENYKKMAVYTVASKHNADTMVGALVNVDTTVYGKLSITVTGYPARYIKFRTMEEKDAWIMKMNKEDKASKEDKKQPAKVGGLLNILK